MKEGFTVLEEIKVPSSFDYLASVEGLIDRVCNTTGVSEDNYGNVLIAVTEAFNNAVVHGNKGDESKDVIVKVALTKDTLCFAVRDQGEGFDYNVVVDPTSPENLEKENGRGIYLMRHLSDDLEFEDNGREVVICFQRNA